MADISEVLSIKNMIDYTKNLPTPDMVGETLFPSKKIDDLEIEMIKGANGTPVAASIHSFDTESEIASREGLSKDVAELALIKRKIRLTEKDIIKLSNPRTTREEQMAIEKVYNDAYNMRMGVLARIEAMRMEALSTGKIIIDENGVKAKIDYGTPAAHKGTFTWSTGTPDILENISTMVKTIRTNTGFTPTRILTSETNLAYMLKDAGIRSAAFGVNSAMMMNQNKLNELLTSNGLPKIAIYDARYRVQDRNGKYTSKRYLPENAFIAIPDGIMGNTFYGPTPEEIRLSQKDGVDVSQIGNVLTMHYVENVDPVSDWIKAVATALPSFPYADQVFMATIS